LSCLASSFRKAGPRPKGAPEPSAPGLVLLARNNSETAKLIRARKALLFLPTIGSAFEYFTCNKGVCQILPCFYMPWPWPGLDNRPHGVNGGTSLCKWFSLLEDCRCVVRETVLVIAQGTVPRGVAAGGSVFRNWSNGMAIGAADRAGGQSR